jgi:alkylation response protein AidB-like acyl-CoA dehydrogenase
VSQEVEMVSLEEFRKEAEQFLSSHAKLRVEKEFVWGEGEEDFGVLPEKSPEEELREVEAAKEWARTAFDAGFGWIAGPPEYGGRGLTLAHERVYRELESKYDVPSQAPRGIGLGMVAPTILAHGTEVTKKRYLRALYRGDIIGCQLFSEPGAGSDLASLQTRAVRDGDSWVITGQKVWTSGAHYSDIGEILCRTDLDAPKHKGITAFVVDMHSKGVEVRPLRQMTGGASFNEVFFNEVRVPDDHRLGEVNEGWRVAITTLMHERFAIGTGGGGVGASGMTAKLRALISHMGASRDPLVRQMFMDVVIRSRIASYTSQRAIARLKAGAMPGPELSITKLTLTDNLRRMSDLVSKVLGPKLAADTGEWGTYAWSKLVLGVPGLRIAGGTDEIMKNIVAERVLGLPKDPGRDTEVPFRELAKNPSPVLAPTRG